MQAAILVCDDLRMEVNGKLLIVGLYTADIVIQAVPFTASQVFVMFVVEGSLSDEQFSWLRFEVTLPGAETITTIFPQQPNWSAIPADRKKWVLKFPVRISPAIYRPGRIEAKVVSDKGEVLCTGPWVIHSAAPPPMMMVAPVTMPPPPSS